MTSHSATLPTSLNTLGPDFLAAMFIEYDDTAEGDGAVICSFVDYPNEENEASPTFKMRYNNIKDVETATNQGFGSDFQLKRAADAGEPRFFGWTKRTDNTGCTERFMGKSVGYNEPTPTITMFAPCEGKTYRVFFADKAAASALFRGSVAFTIEPDITDKLLWPKEAHGQAWGEPALLHRGVLTLNDTQIREQIERLSAMLPRSRYKSHIKRDLKIERPWKDILEDWARGEDSKDGPLVDLVSEQ